ncbi:MAG: GNAT family N-acetyltransferase [Candidatus Pseudobacter hemicellulosilyticus]|uniref:GNAT family N-acetyltransferase n=1 Tax=Candidatus Pseudobacter hemicellulosilyticus TaxID=3121375 RepID=A0AAJ5WSV8_9BACT|nr:MAG: GNAT family N-acetyltransferase [Pseudobacter sp.]
MNAIEVHDTRTAREFIELPAQFYRNDKNWICPLQDDVEAVFDPVRNVFFTHGECTRWLLRNDAGETIGRIAAFINKEKAHKNVQPTGGVGFFECINDQQAAFFLFDTAKAWLQARGMEAMDGPINFGENDKFWGLLVEGFKPPSLGMNYNPPYYVPFFEQYGFRKQYDQLTNFLDATVPLPERFTKIADWVMRKPGYSFKHFDKKQFDKFAADFQEIYNDAWSNFENFTQIEMGTIKESFRQMQAIMDEKIIWFAYYNEEPIAFVLCLPDVNQILRHVNGKLDLWGKLKFLWYKNTTTIERLRIIIMGCKKKYQNHGVESALIRCLQIEVLPRNTIKGVELAWVGDFNDKMLAIHEATGAKKDKVHRTYRCVFGKAS